MSSLLAASLPFPPANHSLLGSRRARARLARTTGSSALDINPLYSIAGFLVGGLVGLTGVGGGALMTPLLVLLFKFHPATAVGTDLLYAAATKSVGTIVHGQRGTVDWVIVRRLAMGSVPAAILTLAILAWQGAPGPRTAATITTMLGVALLVTAVAILFRPWLLARSHDYVSAMTDRAVFRATVLLGLMLGVLVSVSSVGAGSLGVTALLMLYPRMSMAKIAGSDIAHAVPLTLVAGIGHWLIGSVDLSLLVSLLCGSIPGVIIGALVGSRSSDRVLRPILAATLALVGAKLLT